MKIAVDVKGTLDGQKGAKVIDIVANLYKSGHEIYVWSSLFSFAVEWVKKLEARGIIATAESKYSRSEAAEFDKPMMDLAIEDDPSQTYLAAHHTLLVRDIPSNFNEYAAWLEIFLKDIDSLQQPS